MLVDLWQSVRHMAEHPAGLFALVLGAAALLHAALGIGRSRQWYMAPVLFGLVAMAGFLLNPFADASTPHDLRALFMGPEALSLLAIGQFLLTAAMFASSLKLSGVECDSRPSVWLAVFAAVPPPMTVVALLLLEQSSLLTTSGARPEVVGLQVGLGVASMALLAAILAIILPNRWLQLPHSFFSLAILLACMLVPHLQNPLPDSLDSVSWESLDLAWKFAIGSGAVIAAGWCWSRVRQARFAAGLLPRFR